MIVMPYADLSDLQLEILVAAYHDDDVRDHDEIELDGLVETGLLVVDEDDYEVYGYEITDNGEALVEYLDLAGTD